MFETIKDWVATALIAITFTIAFPLWKTADVYLWILKKGKQNV